MQTMFQRYGGPERVAGLVLRFYELVLANPRLGPFFETCDMRRLMEHHARYASWVLDRPGDQTDDELRTVHAPLGVRRGEYDEMLRLFRDAMEETGYERPEIDAATRKLGSLRSLVVTR